MVTRIHFTRELQRLQDEMIMLGSMVAEAIQDAVRSTRARLETAKRLIKHDRTLNAPLRDRARHARAARHTTADGGRSALACRHPESPRTGAHGRLCQGITHPMLGLEPMVKPTPEIQVMADRGTDMMRRALMHCQPRPGSGKGDPARGR